VVKRERKVVYPREGKVPQVEKEKRKIQYSITSFRKGRKTPKFSSDREKKEDATVFFSVYFTVFVYILFVCMPTVRGQHTVLCYPR
jgi:hypothetical protein